MESKYLILIIILLIGWFSFSNQLASNKSMNTLFLICLVGFSWAVAMGLVKQSVRKKNKQTRITLYIITTIIIGAFFIVLLS